MCHASSSGWKDKTQSVTWSYTASASPGRSEQLLGKRDRLIFAKTTPTILYSIAEQNVDEKSSAALTFQQTLHDVSAENPR